MTRTERDLRWLADALSEGRIAETLPERLECLAAWHRTVLEAEEAANGQPHDYEKAVASYDAAIERLRVAGVGRPEGELTFSPCCGPDL